jgi:hypothetical protein
LAARLLLELPHLQHVLQALAGTLGSRATPRNAAMRAIGDDEHLLG